MKRVMIIMLALVFCFSSTLPIYAVNETEMEMQVTYSHTNICYEVVIPAELSLNMQDSHSIYLSRYEFMPYQRLSVYIDGDRTFDPNDGYLHLKALWQNDVKVCVKRNTDTPIYEPITGPGLHEVARFEEVKAHPTKYGQIRFDILDKEFIETGVYTGTVYFIIELTDM